MSRYKVIRFYGNHPGKRRAIDSGLTLEQAQAHCNDPENSSTTCTNKSARATTRRMGPWFDGYVKEGS